MQPVMMLSEDPAARNSVSEGNVTQIRNVARARILMWIVGGAALCGLFVSTAGSVVSTQKKVGRYLNDSRVRSLKGHKGNP
jgi:hypothetical protein